MDITKKKDGDTLKIALRGRLDTNSAMQLDKELHGELDGISAMEIDLAELAYISSSGLRTLLGAHKALKGNVKIMNVQDAVMDVFETTGFSAALNIG